MNFPNRALISAIFLNFPNRASIYAKMFLKLVTGNVIVIIYVFRLRPSVIVIILRFRLHLPSPSLRTSCEFCCSQLAVSCVRNACRGNCSDSVPTTRFSRFLADTNYWLEICTYTFFGPLGSGALVVTRRTMKFTVRYGSA